MLVALGEKGVKTLDDLADLASDELIEIVGAEQHGRGHRERGDHGRPRALVRRRRRRPHMLPPWRRRPATTERRTAGSPHDATTRPETGPLRRCIVTRERLPKERMIRFVVGPDRALVPDLAARLPGRGIWLSAPRRCARNRPCSGARLRAGRARSGHRCPPTLRTVSGPALLGGSASCWVWPAGPARPSPGSKRRGSGCGAGRAGLIVQASDGSAEERGAFQCGPGA